MSFDIQRVQNDITIKNTLVKLTGTEHKADSFLGGLFSEVQRNPKIMNCTQESIMDCAYKVAQSGLQINGRDCHLIPFKDKCTVIVDFKGYVSMILKNPEYIFVDAYPVYETDTFDMNMGQVENHTWDISKSLESRGKIIGFYSMVAHKSGFRESSFMSIEEVEKIRDNSQGYQQSKRNNKPSPWDTNFVEMGKKTVIRRHQKTLNLCTEAQSFFQLQEADLTQAEAPIKKDEPLPQEAEDKLIQCCTPESLKKVYTELYKTYTNDTQRARLTFVKDQMKERIAETLQAEAQEQA